MYVSRYNAYIPVSDGETYVAFNGITGSLDIFPKDAVDRLTETVLSETEISEEFFTSSDLKYLEDRGFVTALDNKEEVLFAKLIAESKIERLNSLPPTIEIIPSYNCQLQCPYCFERNAQQRGKKEGWFSVVMDNQVVDCVFSAIDIVTHGNLNRRIGVYGGEPFIPQNRECIEYIINKGINRGYTFMVTTNGVDLDKYFDLINLNKIECIRITINGPRKVHDKLRHFPDGRPSYHKVLTNLRRLLETDVEIQIRVDVTKEVLNSLEEFAEELISIGFDNNKNASCFCMAAHRIPRCAGNDQLDGQWVNDAEVIKHLYEHPELGEIFRPSRLLSPRIEALFYDTGEVGLNPVHCDASVGIFIFDPFGNIYPCNKVVGLDESKVGTFLPKLSIKEEVVRKWTNWVASRKDECLKCKFLFLCGGGCMYLRDGSCKETSRSYCKEYEDFFRTSIQYYYKRLIIGKRETFRFRGRSCRTC